MTQLNIHMTTKFEQNLRTLMKIRHIETKSEAVRIAILEALERATQQPEPADFSVWLGLAKQVPTNTKLRFKSDDDLWK